MSYISDWLAHRYIICFQRKNIGQVGRTTYGTFTPNYFKKHDHLLHYTEDRNNMRVSKLF